MLLNGAFPKYEDEILSIYKKNFQGEPKGHTFFGIIKGDVLQAFGSVRCYHGHWYLRSCYVKPKFRGKGLQRKLIRERLEYLSDRTDVAKVSVHPWNEHSIDNVLKEGFSLEAKRKLPDGKMANVYRYDFE